LRQKRNGQRRPPRNGAKTNQPMMVRNVYAADGFFRPDSPAGSARVRKNGPTSGGVGGFVLELGC